MTNQSEIPAVWKSIFKFVSEYKQSHGGKSPGRRSIGEHIRHNSTSVVDYYLKGMQDAGLISMPDTYRCDIRLCGEQYIPPPDLD